ncbi:MAG: CHASE2 domain-containing protein, partial [Endomicrobiales bacterium]
HYHSGKEGRAMGKMKLTSMLIAGGTCLFVLLLWWLGALQGLENKSMDYRFKIRGPVPPSPEVVIVAFDEESFKHLGRWPWPRKLHGEVVERLRRAGASGIIFDMLLPEPDLEHPDSDRYFSRALLRSKSVVLASFFQYDNEGKPIEFLLPIKTFLNNSRTGFTNVVPELDGICRKIPLFKEYNTEIVPSLALAGLSVSLGKSPEEILRDKRVGYDEFFEMTINFAGGYESFPYYSFFKVLKGEVPPEKFKDKIVLLGGTASGLFDFKPVPFSPTFPGVEIHANTISNILLNNYLRPWPVWLTFLLILGFAALPVLVLNRFSPLQAGGAVLLALAGYFAVTYVLFVSRFVYAEFVAPAASLSLSYIGVLFYRFMNEEREKRWIKKTFSHYLSSSVLESILADPGRLRLGGQRENLSVLFSDIRGFTTISEGLRPEDVVELLNEYLSKMVEVVFMHDGTLDKFIGDAVMVFWGAPIPQADHPRKAVLCAIDMIEELKKLQEKWKTEGRAVIDIGIGINTGDMVVGNMGSKDKMEYTVIGDNVNLGSRLEGLNKEYKTHIIIADSTYQFVKDIVEARPLGSVKVKGKENCVEIYEVTGRKA